MPAEAMDRVEALRVVFRSLDDDDSGSLDMDEVLRLLVEGVCQRLTLDEAIAYFETLDADGDGTIDEEEYVAAMLHITRDYTAEEFEHEVKHLIARSRKAIEDPKYYFHCDGNREYLGDEVAPLLEKGLEALLSAVEKERLRVATGVDWDEDGYRPDDWRPLRPLRFLGEWLRRNSRTGRAEVAAEDRRRKAESRCVALKLRISELEQKVNDPSANWDAFADLREKLSESEEKLKRARADVKRMQALAGAARAQTEDFKKEKSRRVELHAQLAEAKAKAKELKHELQRKDAFARELKSKLESAGVAFSGRGAAAAEEAAATEEARQKLARLRCVLYKRFSPVHRFQHLIASPFN